MLDKQPADFVTFDAAHYLALQLLHANPAANPRAAIRKKFPALNNDEIDYVIELARISNPSVFGIGAVGRKGR